MKNFLLRNPLYAFVAVAVILVISFGTVSTYAFGGQNNPPPPASGGLPNVPGTKIQKVEDIFTKILQPVFNIAFWLLIVLAALFIIWAAFAYLTANGEPEKISQANKRIVYAAVAVAIAVLARAIPTVICNFISTTGCNISAEGLPT